MQRCLIYAFDYVDSDNLCLQSAINDIHFIWTLVTSKYQLSPEDIMIIGSIDLRGKMLPWKQRCFLDLSFDYSILIDNFLKDTKQLLLYFTGHGTINGKILYGSTENQKHIAELVPRRFLYSSQTWIIADMCYSHLFTRFCSHNSSQHDYGLEDTSNRPSVFIPSSCEHPVAISTQRGSVFTIGFVRTLINDEEHFFKWLADETYYTGEHDTLPFTPLIPSNSPILINNVTKTQD